MAAETSGSPHYADRRRLKRELGLIGAAWASETSIIGSGWLFRPARSALLVGGAAVLDWVIAGVVVIILACAHAELGAMYRSPAGRPGSRTSRSGAWRRRFGFFAYMQAVTIAPIECFAFIELRVVLLAQHLRQEHHERHRRRVRADDRADAIFVAVNFLAMRIFGPGQHVSPGGRWPSRSGHHRAAVQVTAATSPGR